MSKMHNTGALQSFMFNLGLEKKREGLREGFLNNFFWDYFVFNGIREKFGGRVRVLVSGSAPLSPQVKEFLSVCFCCPVMEGYGQTEVAASATMTHPEDTYAVHVGVPMPCVEIKLVDVPEMGYKVTDDPPRGEICIRGPVVSPGYFKDPEKTREALDEKGWLHSGDIGTILPEGTLKVLDRKNNLFKLSLGEYIAPDKLENIYQGSAFVSQCFIHGDSFKSSIVAIVCVDTFALSEWAREAALQSPDDVVALCSNPRVVKHVLDDMVHTGKQAHLKTFELVKAIHLLPTEFGQDLITPTLKVKRFATRTFFKDILAKLYEGLD